MDFKIESNIPLVNAAYKTGSKYPFGKLEIGQSFAIPKAGFTNAQAAGYSWSKRHPGPKFKFRMNGKEGRCWRVA